MKSYSEKKAIYRKISLDIANKIVKGELKEGEKISGRSLLASIYNVSPETIRRAVFLLQQMNVVDVNKGSGIEIQSISCAEKFIQKHKDNEYLNGIKEEISNLIEMKKEIDSKLEINFQKMIDYTERFKNLSPFTLIEVEIKENCKFIDKKINEIHFWQNTGATIIAYRRGEEIIISPGPDYCFTNGDMIVAIGTKDVYQKITSFIY